MNIVGRRGEQRELARLCDSPRPEFAVVYGRRRVGKTYLVREYFGNSFAFYASGIAGGNARVQLKSFHQGLKAAGCAENPPANWWDAFEQLIGVLSRPDARRDEASGKRVLFIDEMPWLDGARSDFLAALEWFWNTWGSAQPDVLLIACGSATSWIVKNLLENRGGLHNRITSRIQLHPFTLRECEEYFRVNGLAYTRQQAMECYMVFGGIPFYFDLMHRRLGIVQNIDRLCFANGAPLKGEFEELFKSLFRHAGQHIDIVRCLAASPHGLTRDELSRKSGVSNGGTLTRTVSELEACGFIRRYHAYGKRSNGALCQLIDPFTLFYLRFVENATDAAFWSNRHASAAVNAWRGYAFELLCLLHAEQVKASLGVAAIATDISSWRSSESDPAAQVDLVIDRADGIVDLCEMKWSGAEYAITKSVDASLRNKQQAFLTETKTRKAVRNVLVTPYGMKRNGYSDTVQAVVTADDLFA